MAFSGGFKIPEEYRRTRESRQKVKTFEEEGEEADIGESYVTKEEIFQSLNLSHAAHEFGVGRHGYTRDLLSPYLNLNSGSRASASPRT